MLELSDNWGTFNIGYKVYLSLKVSLVVAKVTFLV